MLIKDRDLTSSIVLCTHNGQKYIREQLKSIINQTVLPDEIIICDDFSTDETVAIIYSLIEHTEVKTYFFRNNKILGSTKNFEQGINLAKGEIILLADQDDLWSENKIKVVKERFLINPALAAVFSNGNVINEQGVELGYTLWDAFKFDQTKQSIFKDQKCAFNLLMKQTVVTGASMAFKSSLRDLLLPMPISWVHDSWLALLLLANGSVESISEPLIKYRLHSEQQIGARRINAYERYTQSGFKGREIYSTGAQNIQLLLERVINYSIDDHLKQEIVKMGKAKYMHLTKRGKMEKNIYRLPVIFLELLNMNYFRYSNGFSSVLKDIFLS